MRWPRKTWIEGYSGIGDHNTPEAVAAHYSPDEIARVMLARKLHELQCAIGHDIYLCGNGMYSCRKCATWWTVTEPLTRDEADWRPRGFRDGE